MKESLLQKLSSLEELTPEEMVFLFDTDDQDLRDALMTAAYRMKVEKVGREVYFRGIIEFSNQCALDCNYCGIRRSNADVERFRMSLVEIVETAVWAYEKKYASIVLQSGERRDSEFVDFVEKALERIMQATNSGLRITLSLGEQTEETYRRWFNAGASRYLLRIETSNPALFRKIHPETQDFESRKGCLFLLRDAGYQVGTGVLIGLPGQTAEDLVGDIRFFKEMDIDMIGMGPYIVHEQTPMAKAAVDFDPGRQLESGLRMIALTRLSLGDVNIASTTALQALAPDGREQGLLAGANVIMPNLTGVKYRKAYQLYDGKPCMDENAAQCMDCLGSRIGGIGEVVAFGKWGDAPHYLRRTASESVLR